MALAIGAAWCTAALAAEVNFTVSNASKQPRHEVVRVSLPLPRAALKGAAGRVTLDGKPLPAQARVITTHPDGSARRLMLSFPAQLRPGQQLAGAFEPNTAAKPGKSILTRTGDACRIQTQAYTLVIENDRVQLLSPADGATLATVVAYGPALTDAKAPKVEVIEEGPCAVWLRWSQHGTDYGREVDVLADQLGRVKLTNRINLHLHGNAWTPDFGFDVTARSASPVRVPKEPVRFLALEAGGRLADHPQLVASLKLANGAALSMANPLTLRQHRGTLETLDAKAGVKLRFSRLEPVKKENDRLMIQEGQWRVLDLVVQPGQPDALVTAVDEPLAAHADWSAYDAVYHTGPPLKVKHPALRDMVEENTRSLQLMSLNGDDWGNMTSCNPVSSYVPINSMVRYNHCLYVWEDYFRTGDHRLWEVALDWSENYRNLSVYWGWQEKFYGGSRRGRALREKPGNPHGPGTYMQRFNNAVGFCTKGYSSFWLAYEETGDPRFKHAAEAQARYSAKNVHCDRGEMRNVGMIADFAKLYGYTGEQFYLDTARRLWKEFQSKQMLDLMFTQGGKPATGNDLYIPNDAYGYKHPFYKAYITQYATNALPYMLVHCPDDRRLRETIASCNDWMAKVQTAGGGWGYPGPTTAGLGWSPEYCHGLMAGYDVKANPAYLDATQRDVRAMVAIFQARGFIPSGITGWERVAGKRVPPGTYRLGTDRDRSKDFTGGFVGFHTHPDKAVYLSAVLRDYLRHRDEATLFTEDKILSQILRLRTSIPPGVHPLLAVEFTHHIEPVGMAVLLEAKPKGKLEGKRMTCRWELDGTRHDGQTVERTFTTGGKHEAKLVATDGARRFVRTLSFTTPIGPGDLGLERWPAGIRIQAERPTGQGGCDKPVQYWFDRKGADRGAFSHWDKNGHWLEYAFDVAKTGEHWLLLKYACPYDGTRAASLDAKALGEFGLHASGGYTLRDSDDYAVELLRDAAGKPLRIKLAPGRHVLRLANTDGRGCNLDYIEWLPAR